MSDAGLGGEDVTPGDEEGRDVVAELMQGGINIRGVADAFEAVRSDELVVSSGEVRHELRRQR